MPGSYIVHMIWSNIFQIMVHNLCVLDFCVEYNLEDLYSECEGHTKKMNFIQVIQT